MSLHIESTDEALEELKKQRTKTLAAAISVSVLGVALMGLLLYLVHIIAAIPEDPPMVAYATQEGDNPDIDTPEVTQTTQRPSSSSAAAQVKVIAAVASADVAVVNPDIDVEIPTEELSTGIDIGDGFGIGTGNGDGGGIPGIISKRCDLNDRMKRITENGGTPQCEEAVVKSLRWLKKQQNGNGSWGDGQFKASMTGITLLAYLAHCETPLSEEFGENVLKGISFLVDLGMKNPVISEGSRSFPRSAKKRGQLRPRRSHLRPLRSVHVLQADGHSLHLQSGTGRREGCGQDSGCPVPQRRMGLQLQ